MAEEEVRKLVLPYDHTQLPALLASIKNETELRTFILEYAEAKGTSLTENQVNTLIAAYITENNIGSGNSQSGTGLTPEQAQKLAMLLTDGNGEKYLGDDGNYHNIPRDGVDGQNGTNGVDGSDGVGISNITASQSGENVTLTISLTDGTSEQVTFTLPQGSGSGVTTEQIVSAVNSYLTENPVSGVTQEGIAQAVTSYLTENPVQGVSVEDQAKLDKIVIDGDKKKFLNQKGNYVDIEDDVVKEFAEDNTIWGASLPVVFIDGVSGPITHDEYTDVKIRYMSQFKDFTDNATIKLQGNSSLAFPKKNYTIKFATKHGFGWGKAKKWVLKANYIDHSHARNIVCANLWSRIVSSRSDYETDETMIKLASTPNNGAVSGYPIRVYLDGSYQGLYTFNIPKGDFQFGMDETSSQHCVLCGDTSIYSATLFKSNVENLLDGSEWVDEIHDTPPVELLNSWNAVLSFVKNSSDADFRANIGNYLDLQSVIDYYIFSYVTTNLDGFGKNQIFYTYNGGAKWYASAYDLDSTFGLLYDGSRFVSENFKCQDDYESGVNRGRTGNVLYQKLARVFENEIEARYIELRQSVLCFPIIVGEFENFIQRIKTEDYKQDIVIYPTIPSANTNNIEQIRNYVKNRLQYCDNMLITTEISSMSLDNSVSVSLGSTVTLTPDIIPDTANNYSFSWVSSDTSVATVSDGVITPVTTGSVTITVTDTVSNLTASTSLTVTDVAITGITLNESTLSIEEDETALLVATITPSNANGTVTWSTDNPSICRVENGIVTAITSGSANITATVGGYTASCAITVTAKQVTPPSGNYTFDVSVMTPMHMFSNYYYYDGNQIVTGPYPYITVTMGAVIFSDNPLYSSDKNIANHHNDNYTGQGDLLTDNLNTNLVVYSTETLSKDISNPVHFTLSSGRINSTPSSVVNDGVNNIPYYSVDATNGRIAYGIKYNNYDLEYYKDSNIKLSANI